MKANGQKRIDRGTIEVAAQAIHAVVGIKCGRPRPWESLPPSLRKEFREEAKAALEAAKLTHSHVK